MTTTSPSDIRWSSSLFFTRDSIGGRPAGIYPIPRRLSLFPCAGPATHLCAASGLTRSLWANENPIGRPSGIGVYENAMLLPSQRTGALERLGEVPLPFNRRL